MRTAAIIVLTCTLTGCISYHSDSAYTEHQISSVRPGKTTSEWLRDNVGKPKRIMRQADDSELWHYEFDEREETDFSFFLIFNFSSETESSTDYFFEVVDGVVEDYWRE